jgi:hypothetical protein
VGQRLGRVIWQRIKEVRREVSIETKGFQVQWDNTFLIDGFLKR